MKSLKESMGTAAAMHLTKKYHKRNGIWKLMKQLTLNFSELTSRKTRVSSTLRLCFSTKFFHPSLSSSTLIKYSVRYLIIRDGLNGGWKDFAEQHSLKVEDALVISLVISLCNFSVKCMQGAVPIYSFSHFVIFY